MIAETRRLHWNDFIALVYLNYPVRTQPRTALDLVALAEQDRADEGPAGPPR